jgi:hypothetical protein
VAAPALQLKKWRPGLAISPGQFSL